MIYKVTVTETIKTSVMVDAPNVEAAENVAQQAVNHYHQVDEHTIDVNVEEVLDCESVETPVWSKPTKVLEVAIP